MNKVGCNNIDNHADTCCLGQNFRPTYITDQVCEVTPYHQSYSPIKDVPVVSACTAWDNPHSGETILLQINQGLWFGKSMVNSLFCPNQIRVNGISLCDDPFDKFRDLGMMCFDIER